MGAHDQPYLTTWALVTLPSPMNIGPVLQPLNTNPYQECFRGFPGLSPGMECHHWPFLFSGIQLLGLCSHSFPGLSADGSCGTIQSLVVQGNPYCKTLTHIIFLKTKKNYGIYRPKGRKVTTQFSDAFNIRTWYRTVVTRATKAAEVFYLALLFIVGFSAYGRSTSALILIYF